MRESVKQLRELYRKGAISKAKIDELLEYGKITQEEYDYIVGDDNG